MHDHHEILALAAAAIDFELSPAERSQLDAALETCSLCRRQASAMRATATILRRPSDIGTPTRVRDVVIGAALRGGRRSPRFGSLLVASLSLLVVIGGSALIVGNRGFGLVPTTPTASVPGPAESAATTASSPPTLAPESSPSSVATTTPAPSFPAAVGPLRPGDVAAMVTDGRVVIRTKPGTGADSAVFKTRVYPGQRLLTLEGPVEANGYPWYRVRLGDIEGWAAGAGIDGETWLAPVRNGVIAFVRGDGADAAIFTVGPDGTNGEQALHRGADLADYQQLAWSPDGRRLVFVATPSEGTTQTSEVFVIDADGSNLVQLTDNDVDDTNPAWSPDGTRIAIEQRLVLADETGDFAGGAVLVMNADGSGVQGFGEGSSPVWSPDGQQLAITVPDGSASQVFVQPADGGERREIATFAVLAGPPSWSPDGLRIVVSAAGLYLIDVATGTVTPLDGGPGVSPSWSIDGTIAFTTTGSVPGIFVIGSDGNGRRAIGEELGVGLVPEWSPDGRRLLLGGETPGSALAIAIPTGGRVTTIGPDDVGNRSPAWQPVLP